MLAKFLVRAVFAALGLWVASVIVPGVDVNNTGTLIVAAILLGVVNAFVRPIVFILTLPLEPQMLIAPDVTERAAARALAGVGAENEGAQP